ncbi:MAG: tRNA (adenosine(37)-N6)-threonylcarbamoyltransferase complex ATPase subunit type 1 TsaE [Planctomycetia bacterium]|nr:tRNA (adenosine(37)-N6)-threonylcarbamoyltransferase complex ATPase subunit type 1 TsaE [Planctomycetia bacterium]
MRSTPDAPPCVTVRIADEAGLARVAAVVAAALPDRACLALEGDLGAGKTTFVKAIAAALGLDPAEVVSPTFGLIHVHEGPRGRLVHADFHRLASPAELRETGWEEALAVPPGRACRAFVEWPERIAGLLPARRLDVSITVDSETGRTLAFTSRSPDYAPLIRALADVPRA